jgi:hypothetical protein
MTYTVKRNLLIAALLTPFLIIAAPARADNDGPFFGQYAAGKWIIGAKAAKVQNGADGFEDGTATGLMIGYEFARPVGFDGSIALEIELLKSGNAAIDPSSSFLSGQAGEWDANVTNAFFAYRTPGTVFFKGKVGVQRSLVQIKIPGFTSESDDISMAWGVGLGLRLSDWGVLEAEYSSDTATNEIGLMSINAMATF